MLRSDETKRPRGAMRLPAAALAFAIGAGTAAAASIDGDATYRERIAPPASWTATATATATADPAITEPRLLELRSVRAPAADSCTVAAMTQAAMAECAYEEFLEASAALSAQLVRVESGLSAPRKSAWRRLQKSWLTYRTEGCSFESGASAGGSVQPMLQWRCAARFTRARTAELVQAADCREGDLTCARPAR